MPPRKLILGFLLRFGLIYGLLIAPWPGWSELYSEGFRAVGNAVFGSSEGQRLLYFEAHRETRGLASLDTRIVRGNRALADSTGKGTGQMLGIDPRSIGWTPTALTIAFIAATPIPSRRKVGALIWGLLWIHAFILFSVWVYIWNSSTEVSLVTLSPFWKEFADNLQYTLITQMGVSFSVPVLIWILVCFRREDRKLKGL